MTKPKAPAPFSISHLDHVVLRVHDPVRMTRFYVDVLGCTVERKLDIGLTQLRAGRALIDLVAIESKLGGESTVRTSSNIVSQGGRNLDHFCLRVTPFEPAPLRAFLTAHGVQCSEVRQVYGAEGFGPSIYLEDPEHNTIELKGEATAPAR